MSADATAPREGMRPEDVPAERVAAAAEALHQIPTFVPHGAYHDGCETFSRHVLASALPDYEVENRELREAYEEWQRSGQAMHRVLLDIWHMVTPHDTKYLTYGDDPETVFQAVGEYRATVLNQAADDWQRGAWADAPRRPDRVQERIANGQYVGTWLRDRAAQASAVTEEGARG